MLSNTSSLSPFVRVMGLLMRCITMNITNKLDKYTLDVQD